jgi:hypothetical protein
MIRLSKWWLQARQPINTTIAAFLRESKNQMFLLQFHTTKRDTQFYNKLMGVNIGIISPLIETFAKTVIFISGGLKLRAYHKFVKNTFAKRKV